MLHESVVSADGTVGSAKNNSITRLHAAQSILIHIGFTLPVPWPQEIRSQLPACSDRLRLVSSFCSSDHDFVPHFLPTLGHPHAVALPFVRFGQLTGGLSPPSSCPCWAHISAKAEYRLSLLPDLQLPPAGLLARYHPCSQSACLHWSPLFLAHWRCCHKLAARSWKAHRVQQRVRLPCTDAESP